jgi:SAM-dependent methyltransferase
MLPRILEPEVMDTASEAEDYNAMDHTAVNRTFVDDFLAALTSASPPADRPWRIFDAGTGTALIPVELLRRGFHAEIVAADLADQMLLVAARNVAAAGLKNSIRLVRRDCKRLVDPPTSDECANPQSTPGASRGERTDQPTLPVSTVWPCHYDAVMSNSLLHHIPDPSTVLQECWRIVRPRGLLFFRDLLRPRTIEELERLVQTYAATANDHGRQMFRNSLHAALTIDEVAGLAEAAGLPRNAVRATSDRHWTLAAIKPERPNPSERREPEARS